MSLLSPERICIGLGATYAALGRVRGNQVRQWRMQRCTPEADRPWQAALETVAGWLADQNGPKAPVTIALSAELAPLCLLPWRDDLTRPEQQALLAQAQLRRVHGEAALHWKTLARPLGFGRPWLASGTDERLLQALDDMTGGTVLDTVQPLAATLFNRWPARNRTGWLLVPEPARLTALHVRDGMLRLVRNMPRAAADGESLDDTLRREARLAALPEAEARVYSVSRDLPGANHIEAGWQAGAAFADAPLHLLGGRA